MTLSRLFIGKKIRLTAMTPDDVNIITAWYHDSEFVRLMDSSPAYPRPQKKWEKWLDERHEEKDVYILAIRPLNDDKLLGWLELDGISWTNGTASLGIGIGEAAERGKGYGGEAITLLLDFAFAELNLHRVQLTVFAYNARALRLYEYLGFTREGVFREFLKRDGQRYDMILYGMLNHEWTVVRSQKN